MNFLIEVTFTIYHKGIVSCWHYLLIPELIALAGAGFIDAWSTTKASVHCLEARQVDYIQGICPLGARALILFDLS